MSCRPEPLPRRDLPLIPLDQRRHRDLLRHQSRTHRPDLLSDRLGCPSLQYPPKPYW